MSTGPSRWTKRLPLALLALVACGISARLGAFQLGVAAPPVDPFFGEGTRAVLTSSVSRALPVPDAVMGALAYLVEAALTVVGGASRWRTHPWLAIAYGGVAALMAVTSLVLTALQPLVAHAGCTLCLASAAISLIIVGPALREAFAALRHVRGAMGHGAPTFT